eukprot:gene4622-8195_t
MNKIKEIENENATEVKNEEIKKEPPKINTSINGFFDTLSKPENGTVKSKLVKTTAIMFSVPFIVYFFCFHQLFDGLIVNYDLNTRMFWSAICSVVTVQIILIWFIITAIEESKEEDVKTDKLFKDEISKKNE